jgi:hypothetical protein
MTRIVFESRIGNDGVLHLEVPLSADDAHRRVRITIEPIDPPTVEEWQRGIDETAGRWQGDWVRPEQGEFEQRESLS